MKTKRRLIAISSAIVLIAAAAFLARYYLFGCSLSDFLRADSSRVTRVFMRDGHNGNSVSTTDKAKIRQLLNLVDRRRYTRAADQEKRAGYDYFYNFYVGNKMMTTITGSGSTVDVNGTRYDVSRPISSADLKSWFESLPAAKWPAQAS